MTSALGRSVTGSVPRFRARKPPRARVPPRARRFNARHPGPFAACATPDASRNAGSLRPSGRAGRPPGRHGLGLRRLRGQVVRVAASRPRGRRRGAGFLVHARPPAAVGADSGSSGCHGPAASARPPRGGRAVVGARSVRVFGPARVFRSGHVFGSRRRCAPAGLRSGRVDDDWGVRAAPPAPRPVHGERGAHARNTVRPRSAAGAERTSGTCAGAAPRRGLQRLGSGADRSSGRTRSGDGDGRDPAASAGRPGAGAPLTATAAAAAAARRRPVGHGPLTRRATRRATTGGASDRRPSDCGASDDRPSDRRAFAFPASGCAASGRGASDRRAPGVHATPAAGRPACDPRRPSADGAAARRRARAAAGTVPRPPGRVDRRSLRDARRGSEHRAPPGGTGVPRVRRRTPTGSPRRGARAASASR